MSGSASALSGPAQRKTGAGRVAFGIALLEAIDAAGSITAAGKHLGMSYRRWSACCILNRMAQYIQSRVDVAFAALSDPVRRGVLEQLSLGDASVTLLAERFHMTLTGMRKHIGVLEHAELVVTQKVGRVRSCQLGPRRLEEAAAWIEAHRRRWAARFDLLDTVIEELKRKETQHGRTQRA